MIQNWIRDFPVRDPRRVLETDLEVEDPEFPGSYYLDDVLPATSPLFRDCVRHGPHAFSRAYQKLVLHCLDAGARQLNARTGTEVRTLLHQRIDHEVLFGAPLPGIRKVYPRTAAAELAWSLLGTEDVSFMSRHASIWDKFAHDGKVDGAYGHRWRRAFGRDQIALAIDTLARDPSSRQVYISAWDPATDGLDAGSRALAPCPVGFSLQIVAGRLNMMVHLRSSDLAVGLPYDTLCYTYLLAALAEELDVIRGRLSLMLDHAHIYAHHAEALTLMHQQGWRGAGCVPIPRWSVRDIEADPDGYVAAAKNLAKNAAQPAPHALEAVGAAG